MGADYKHIYEHHADRYEALVAAEDCDGNLLAALEAAATLRGATVVEIGAGTGRLTRLVAPFAARVTATEVSASMLAVARSQLAHTSNVALVEADARALPVPSGEADIALAGWVYGHLRHWHSDTWRHEIGLCLDEMLRALRPGGVAVVIETLGTGSTEARAPNDALAEYYAWLEGEHGFSRSAIRTDYAFTSVEEAASITGFFFGDAFAARVTDAQWTRVPECTGVWSRTKAS